MGGRKVCWIKWLTVCLPRSKGGLGVRDMRMVNFSLLAKWRWRLIQPDQALWKEVLCCKYGNQINYLLNPGENCWPSYASRWWLDVVSLEGVVGVNWFNTEVVRKVGNGENTRFWLDHWVGNEALCLTYPRLFLISSQKDATGREVWMDGVEGGSWNLLWRRNLFVWEEGLFQSLLGEVEGWVKTVSVDSWWWKLEDEGKFTVSSSYELLVGLVLPHEFLSETKEMVFGSVWKSPAPSKVVAFSWQLLLDRIPTKDNLLRRRILPPKASVRCVCL
jgi:hypothetical protein